MYENIGKYYFLNGERKEPEAFVLEDMPSKCIYEVMRVKNNKALFIDGHLLRLEKAIQSRGLDTAMLKVIKDQIECLIKDHAGLEKNIKIDVDKDYCRLYFVKSSYPDQSLYSLGVKTKLFNYRREDPQYKILNMDYKKTIESIKGSEYFEVLLVNEEEMITEGSRSNIIFILEDKLIGAPSKRILPGITYQNVIHMAKEKGFDLIEEGIYLNQLSKVSACFLTGTSLGILPIQSIDGYEFNSSNHHIVKSLLKGYNEYVGK